MMMMMTTCHTLCIHTHTRPQYRTTCKEPKHTEKVSEWVGVQSLRSSISIPFVSRLASSSLPLLCFVRSSSSVYPLPLFSITRSFTPSTLPSLLITWSLSLYLSVCPHSQTFSFQFSSLVVLSGTTHRFSYFTKTEKWQNLFFSASNLP